MRVNVNTPGAPPSTAFGCRRRHPDDCAGPEALDRPDVCSVAFGAILAPLVDTDLGVLDAGIDHRAVLERKVGLGGSTVVVQRPQLGVLADDVPAEITDRRLVGRVLDQAVEGIDRAVHVVVRVVTNDRVAERDGAVVVLVDRDAAAVLGGVVGDRRVLDVGIDVLVLHPDAPPASEAVFPDTVLFTISM